jgi:hypothetical protein
MTSDAQDPTLHRLRRLPLLEPDCARSERVRRRCRTAIAERHLQAGRATASRRVTAVAVESGLAYGLSFGYLLGVIDDLLRVYMRR